MWEPRGFPLAEIGVGQLVCARSRLSFILKGGSNSCDTHFGITWRELDHLEDEATLQSSFFSFFQDLKSPHLRVLMSNKTYQLTVKVFCTAEEYTFADPTRLDM
jgi:hypothetical protein